MFDRQQDIVNSVVSQTPNAATYGGAASAFVFWGLRLADWGVIVSALVAVTGLAVQVFMTLRRDKRERELHRARMETLHSGDTESHGC